MVLNGTYGSVLNETCTHLRRGIIDIIEKGRRHIQVIQRAMERQILSIFLIDRIPNKEIRQRIGVTDGIEQSQRLMELGRARCIIELQMQTEARNVSERKSPTHKMFDDLKRVITNQIHTE